jgi:nicotinamide-nucleotide amidase
MNSVTTQLAFQLGELLSSKQFRVTTAESCTGGGIAKAITEISGSSVWFEAGFVTYSNRMKSQLLGVPDSVFEEFGAVSDACVRAMAEGALNVSGAECVLAVSGVAGPSGGSPQKPVGCVYLAWGTRAELHTRRFQFEGSREQVREQTIEKALALLLDEVAG